MTSATVELLKLDLAIHDIYQEFHRSRPEVKPKEVGLLGQLWAEFDYWSMIEEEQLNDL